MGTYVARVVEAGDAREDASVDFSILLEWDAVGADDAINVLFAAPKEALVLREVKEACTVVLREGGHAVFDGRPAGTLDSNRRLGHQPFSDLDVSRRDAAHPATSNWFN